MSRTKAKENLDLEVFKDTMKDVWTSSVGISTIDEAPGAYKSMESIIDNIQDTLEVETVVKPLYNFKAN